MSTETHLEAHSTDNSEHARARAMDVLRSTTPSDRVGEVLDIGEDASPEAGVRQEIFGAVERLTGMRLGEIQCLVAVAEGADHHRGIARTTGQVDAAAAATVAALVRKGALGRHHHPKTRNTSADPTLVHLTPTGRALLAQSEAIRVRLLDAVIDSLDGAAADDVRLAAQTLTQTLGAAVVSPPQLLSGNDE